MLNIPFIILCVLICINLGMTMEADGKPRTGKYNVWVTFVSGVIFIGLTAWAIWWGF